MALSSYTIKSWTGGISDEAKVGVAGSFRNGFNMNIHKKGSNTLSANQKLKSIGGATIKDKIIKIVPISQTKSYGFGDAGYIYKIDNEVVTEINKDTNGKILDADYFYGYLYWTTAQKLGRMKESDLSGYNQNFKTLYNCDYHPIFIAPKSDQMFIGNDNFVAMLDSNGNINQDALDLFMGWSVRCLDLKKPELLIGAVSHKNAELFTWDFISQDESYNPVEGWEERDINAILTAVGGQYLFTPTLLYWFREGLVDLVKELPSQVNPGAIDIWKNKMIFGCNNGVYSLHRRNRNYPLALNLEYTPSPITLSNFSSKNIDIGAVLGRGDQVLVSWKDGTSYGLDILDNTAKAEALYEGLMFDSQRPEEKLFRHIKLVTKPLPKGCSVRVKYRMNDSDTWVAAKMEDKNTNDDKEIYDRENGTKAIYTIEGQGENYQVRVELYPSGNNTPEILEIHNYFKLVTLY